MKCADAEKCIALDVEGDLPEARVVALRNHLAACAPCGQFAQEIRESQQVLKSLRHEMPPESLVSGARQAALEELRTQPRDGGWGWAAQPRLRWVYAAGGLAVVAWATMGWLALQRSETPAPVTDAADTRNQVIVQENADPSALRSLAKSSEDSQATEDVGKLLERDPAARPGTATAIRARDESMTDVKSVARNVVTAPLSKDFPAFDAPVAPRVEIVSTSFSENSPDLDSDTTVLKIASKDPNVLLYWVMDGQGGS